MAHLSISKAWDDTKAIMSSDGRLLTTVAVALVGLPSVVSALIQPQGMAMDEKAPLWVDVVALLFMLVALVGQLALVRLALKPPVTVGEAIRHGARRMPTYLGTALILVALLLVIALPFGFAAKAMGIPLDGTMTAPPPGGWLLVLLFLAVVLYAAVRMLMGTPVASAERAGAFAIIRRSWELTQGHVLKLLGFLLLILFGALIAIAALGMLVGGLVTLALGPIEPMSVSALAVGLAQGLFNAGFTALFAVMLTRIYVQLSGRDTVEV